MVAPEELQARRFLTLDRKLILTRQAIESWYEFWAGRVYVAFSGGRDSTVLLQLVRDQYPEVPAVFIDTGLEYPEVKQFVKKIDNVTWLRPRLSYQEIIRRYGYPVVSKTVSMGLDRYRTTKSEDQKRLRLWGGINPTSKKQQQPSIPQEYHYLTEAPFKCSERCCSFMKKEPFGKFNKLTGRVPYIGTMADDSYRRQLDYLKYGCNAFDNKKPRSTPLGFWTHKDILQIIKDRKIQISDIYKTENHTGCMFCLFGVQNEAEPNRFQRMKVNHPKQYNYCMEKLGIKSVLEYMNLPYDKPQTLF